MDEAHVSLFLSSTLTALTCLCCRGLRYFVVDWLSCLDDGFIAIDLSLVFESGAWASVGHLAAVYRRVQKILLHNETELNENINVTTRQEMERRPPLVFILMIGPECVGGH